MTTRTDSVSTTSPAGRGRRASLVVASYLAVYLVWGSTYFFIKQAVETIPPFWVLGMRWTVGGLIVLGLSIARGRLKSFPRPREILASLALGTLLLLVGNGGITIAERKIDSYIAALLASSTPITVALFDGLLLRKRVTLIRMLGVAGGFAGIAFLLYDGRSLATSLNPSVALGLVGVLSWGFATSLGHRFPVHGDNAVNSGIQMLFVGLVCVGGSLLLDAPPSAVLSAISPASLLAVAYLALLGSIAFSAYTYLVSWEPAERVVSYAFVNPLIALLIGIGIGGEAPTPFLPLGVALAIAGLGLTLYGERAISLIKARKGPRG